MKTQPSKPSIAARELAEKLATHTDGSVEEFFTRRMLIGEAAALIQSALGDLLEKAQTLNVYIEARWGDSDATIQGLNRPLKSSLEPWKVGE